MESIVNIIAAVLACLGCTMILAATIGLARRRFFEPGKDKKLWITAIALLFVAAVLFSPTKSIDRDVKQAVASVGMAVRRTAYAKEATVTCQKLNASGDVLSACQYKYTRSQNERHYAVADGGAQEPWRGDDIIGLLEYGMQDTGYGRVEEKITEGGYTYRFIKSLKQLIAQRQNVLDNMQVVLNAKIPIFKNGKAITEAEQEAMQKQNEQICKAYKSKLQIYQWEETYVVDKSGYITEWQIFCDAKDKDGKRVQRRYVYKVSDLVKDK